MREATGLILGGKVKLGTSVCDKPGTSVSGDDEIQVEGRKKYASRGGLKLEAALKAFGVNPDSKVCADAGCANGGFTDVLIQSGAAKVFAIDTSYGELDWNLRENPSVVVMERTNAAHLDSLPEPVDLVVIDISLLPSKMILPSVKKWLKADGEIVMLLKPQYELPAELVPQGGIIKDSKLHKQVITSSITWCLENGLVPSDLIKSPIKGGGGNVEFLLHIKLKGESPALEHFIKKGLGND